MKNTVESVKKYKAVEQIRLRFAIQQQLKANILKEKEHVKAVNSTNKKSTTKKERIIGRIIEEYENFYLVEGQNYNQTIAKNSLINGDVKIVSCS